MKKIKELIKGQVIRIDNHNRGTSKENDINDKTQDVHIHKYFYRNKSKKKKYSVEIRIPLNHQNSVELSNEIPKQIYDEIIDVLNSEEERSKFLDGVYKELRDNWKWTDTQEKRTEIASKVASAFGLKLSPQISIHYETGVCKTMIFLMIPLNADKANKEDVYRLVADKDKGFEIGQTTHKYAFYVGGVKHECQEK